MSEANAEGC